MDQARSYSTTTFQRVAMGLLSEVKLCPIERETWTEIQPAQNTIMVRMAP